MRRFYLPPEKCGKSMVLEDREAHHAIHVLRLGVGDRLEILDGAGGIYSCAISAVRKSVVELRLEKQITLAPPPWRITLFQAVPKGKTFDWIVEKATELGVARIVPIITERVVAGFENNERRLERWNLTAIDALKQCGSPWLPQIAKPLEFAAALPLAKELELTLVASLRAGAKHPREWLQQIEERKAGSAFHIGVWIGPEGDFTGEELTALAGAGARPITLGHLVLRAETAAIYCISIINYEMQARGDLRGISAPERAREIDGRDARDG